MYLRIRRELVTNGHLLAYERVDDARDHKIGHRHPRLTQDDRLVKVLGTFHLSEDVVKGGSTSECQDDVGSGLYSWQKPGIVKHADIEEEWLPDRCKRRSILHTASCSSGDECSHE